MEKSYETENMIIYWKPYICEHAGECVRGAPKVFEVGRRPWIIPENGREKDIARVIDRCPSGALSYKYKGDVNEK
ncbi:MULTISPECIES: (4Fe-4S)-binding protein [Enterococcus]|uniref:(4Fe-4S)-binding protein n=1 Tax=Enterococcus TaxID=1350 RepID=UPI001164B091|nr:(4Fe-4S)-binding protein [Enterococcus avium]HAP3021249.1 (4Fe-4S)-binding protein [Enterococcus faecalis]AYQ24175.1 (4Fe-4S)-binding protein [Enterococcus avium]HBI1562080.1 (4Fe-4S)-binding protein [Enterococcus faecalis]HBI1565139.1 (4Fe-4S)-binding protein [Enterococcus faecalis]HBI1717451.1 (4Fe-4S)-binding protein [Enterococcus faecalis]